MRKKLRNRYLIGASICLLIGLFIYVIEQNIEHEFRMEIRKSLLSLVQTTSSAVNIIVTENIQTVTSTAMVPTIIESTEKLINTSVKVDSLDFHPAKEKVDVLTRKLISIQQYDQYYILTPDNKVLISSNIDKVEFDKFNQQYPLFLQNIWKGNSQMSQPFKQILGQPPHRKLGSNDLNTILIGTAIRNSNNEIIAALIFCADPNEKFGPVLSSAQIGETGKTYAINSSGLLFSESRFNKELQSKGLLQKNTSSTLNIVINPNRIINLDNFNFNENSMTVNMKGYTDYRGETVIGAWLWDSRLQVFIITEIDRVQAYASIYQIRQISIFTYIISCIIYFFLIFLFYKNKKRLDDKNILLESSKLRLRLAFENIPSGNIVSDWNGNIEEFSKSAESIFGYTADEVIGKNINILMPEPNRSHHNHYIKKFLETGEEKIIDSGGRNLTALHKKGHTFPIHLCLGTMVIDYELHFIASITDKTLQTKIDKQLSNSQKMNAFGQLASGLAHDFNNLLGIAMGNLQLLQRKATLDDYSVNKVSSSLKALERGSTLTRQLLNFSRADSSNTETLNINDCIMDIMSLIEQTATKNVQVTYSLEDGLLPVNVNLGDFGDALINMTANARDAMPQGGSLCITTSACDSNAFILPPDRQNSPDKYIQLTVSDTGEGIPTEKIDRIFEPFYTTKDKNKGTGLGLAMVYKFIQNSKGEITVRSNSGLGTSFKMYLPVSSKRMISTSQTSTSAVTGGKETILLVDDEVELLTIAEANLEDEGYHVLIANSASTALSILKEHQVDLLLTDIIMPGDTNGYQLAILCMSQYPEIKIALTSGYSAKIDELVVENVLLASQLAQSILPKPYDRTELLNHIRYQLDLTPNLVWSEHFLTGIEALDNDHKALFLIINQLFEKVIAEDDVLSLPLHFTQLKELIDRHNHRESIIMSVCNIPQSDQHTKEHQQHIKLTAEYNKNYESLNTKTKKLEILQSIANALVTHVQIEAKDFANIHTDQTEVIHQALLDDINESEH